MRIRNVGIMLVVIVAAAGMVFGQATVKTAPAGIDKGDFKVGFSPKTKAREPKKAVPAEVAEILKEIATPMNELIALPYDVYLNFDQCGEPNAFYSSDTKEITMCYEFMDYFETTFKKKLKDPKEIESRVADTTVFFFFHELGHCLIDVWDLPATGREEDAVDQLATIIMLDGTPEGLDMVISGAMFFSIASAESKPDELAFWDEHSVDQQRMFDTLCLAYGSDPVKNKGIVANGYLPPERGQRCGAEYKKISRAWERLLTPYAKE